MNATLHRRLDEMDAYARERGWITQRQEHEAEGCTNVIAWGAGKEVDGYDFMFITVLGVNERTGRCITLIAPEYHNARCFMEIEDGGRYWRSERADAWRHALDDPLRWCSLVPASEDDPRPQ